MPASSIRAFVQWADQTVFAGEDVECKITFKNVAPAPGAARATPQPPKLHGFSPGGERQRKTVPLQGAANSARPGHGTPQSPRSPQPAPKGHRPTLSLNVPVSTGGRPSSALGELGHRHKRSVSIISLGSEAGTDDAQGGALQGHGQPQSAAGRRPGRGHGRSASLQVLPRRPAMNGGPLSPGNRAATQPPFFPPSNSISEYSDLSSPARTPRGAASRPAHTRRTPSESLSQNFQFPTTPASRHSPHRSGADSSGVKGPLSKEEVSRDPDLLVPATRVIAGSSLNGGTPRSSAEFYSMSNNSTDTLASDYVSQTATRLLARPAHLRRTSQLGNGQHARPPETLMMGYAQITGSFTLDGSLVNQAPFEEVKRKGVVGGQGGGGVVGVESKSDGGLFGALGWGNIGESIGGLLGGGELSSIKEMRGIASSKAIPLLSTPQSILFVDLRLAPGESKTYDYSFTLPNGLPPSHKGKAIKVSYGLVISTQRAGTAKEGQQVRRVDVPFRVFGGVNGEWSLTRCDPELIGPGRGELLGHDLMSPYVILKDQARTGSGGRMAGQRRRASQLTLDTPLQGFLSYVDGLLESPRDSNGLTSPAEPTTPKQQSEPTATSAREAIDLAILRSNTTTASNRSANRFEIARNGRRVAVLHLARPAYRLGETLHAVFDFGQAAIPTYALRASLESAETVDAALALRSAASIARVTRRVHAQQVESTLFARRVVFAPAVPVGATPEFATTGVSLEWKLRVEFVTTRASDLPPAGDEGSSAGSEASYDGSGLLEEASRDERARIEVAVQTLACESFEVAIPLRIYGAVGGDVGDAGKGGGEGLVL
ncbi:MAG: hypothetical protein M1832_004009 [Thelocarpon impressellum]|nr:MAG: hypothetical protein M1832_004009 [Thelocarpon impressellum]